jgi:Uma2 family endonuclease
MAKGSEAMSSIAELARDTETVELALDPEREYEIVNGKPEAKEMAGARHGGITARLLIEMGMHIKLNKLGAIYTPDTTFKIGQNDRLPDISFVSAERIPAEGEPESPWDFAPDLAVEVVSPNDLWEGVQNKLHEYFAAGVREVWLVAPDTKELYVYTAPRSVRVLAEEDELTTELLPGFRCKLSEIFQLPV